MDISTMARPPKYKTADELDEKIKEYFTVDDVPTVPGLAYHLGYCSRQSIWDLKQDEKYSYSIKKALLKIESSRNKALIQKGANTAGLIFDLVNNFGWENKQRQEVTGKDGDSVNIKIVWPENGLEDNGS